jgi:transcriptional regulator with XRE-family HTH domain
MDINAIEIGQRIHVLRLQQGFSLREMAEQSGLTASFLSQVERGRVNSSIESLRRITNSLGVSMVQLLESRASDGVSEQAHADDAPHHTNPVTSSSRRANGKSSPVVIRADNRPKLLLPHAGVTIEMLTSSRAHAVEVFISKLAPGTEIMAQPLREPTEQFIYVLSGSLHIELSRIHSVLECGDAITFDGTTVKRFVCVGNQATTWLCMITPPVF